MQCTENISYGQILQARIETESENKKCLNKTCLSIQYEKAHIRMTLSITLLGLRIPELNFNKDIGGD